MRVCGICAFFGNKKQFIGAYFLYWIWIMNSDNCSLEYGELSWKWASWILPLSRISGFGWSDFLLLGVWLDNSFWRRWFSVQAIQPDWSRITLKNFPGDWTVFHAYRLDSCDMQLSILVNNRSVWEVVQVDTTGKRSSNTIPSVKKSIPITCTL